MNFIDLEMAYNRLSRTRGNLQTLGTYLCGVVSTEMEPAFPLGTNNLHVGQLLSM